MRSLLSVIVGWAELYLAMLTPVSGDMAPYVRDVAHVGRVARSIHAGWVSVLRFDLSMAFAEG